MHLWKVNFEIKRNTALTWNSIRNNGLIPITDLFQIHIVKRCTA